MIGLIPHTMKELQENLQFFTSKSRIVAGGTDFVIRQETTNENPDYLLYVGQLKEAREIRKEKNSIWIGAAVTMQELQVFEEFPAALEAIRDSASDVGSPQIRNKATIGGNVLNASPAGDLIPVLFMLHAKAMIFSADGKIQWRTMEELVTGPGKHSLKAGEILIGFALDEWEKYVSAFYKLGFRQKVSISRIGISISVCLDEQQRIQDAKIYAGAVYAVPIELEEAQDYLIGKRMKEVDDHTLGKFLSDKIRQINATKFYKRNAACGVMEDVMQILRRRLIKYQENETSCFSVSSIRTQDEIIS